MGNDAEGAAVAAALLDFEIGAGLLAGLELGLFEERVGKAVVGPDGRAGGDVAVDQGRDADQVCRLGRGGGAVGGQVEEDGGRKGLVAVADDGGHTGEGGEFRRGALRIAAGDDDLSRGVDAVGAADESAGCAVRFGGDAAGVDDDEVGGRGRLLREPGGAQMVADCLAIGACSAASEMFHVESGHLTSLTAFWPRQERALALAGAGGWMFPGPGAATEL